MHISQKYGSIGHNSMKGADAVNPRIFISSTFYDLKYAREDLGEFIRGFGFEPIRSESGNIGYTPGVELDESCYAAMQDSDMAILIVGGRYGSPASGETPSEDAFRKFSSVTYNEFKTAVANNVPTYVFIEDGVYNMYRFYKKNKKEIEAKAIALQFEAIDNINVLRFVDDIHQVPKLSIFGFKTIAELKDILRLQWADLFRKYLISLKQQAAALRQVEPQMTLIYGQLQEIRVMVQRIGQSTFADEPQEMASVCADQAVENAASKIAGAFEFVSSLEADGVHAYLEFFVNQLFEAKRQGILEYPFSDNPEDQKAFSALFDHEHVCIAFVKGRLAFEDGIFEDSDGFRAHLVDRLCQPDYLKKMHLL